MVKLARFETSVCSLNIFNMHLISIHLHVGVHQPPLLSFLEFIALALTRFTLLRPLPFLVLIINLTPLPIVSDNNIGEHELNTIVWIGLFSAT